MILNQASEYPIRWDYNSSHGGDITPKFIVLHYTAGGTLEGSLSAIKRRGLSAHFFIGREGEIVQTVEMNKRAYHAGKSNWMGYTGLNYHSIGIEICNYGWLDKIVGHTAYRTHNGVRQTPVFKEDEFIIADHENGWPKGYGWEIYDDPQIKATYALCKEILNHYDILDIAGHDEIAPERKTDPGPALPMQHFRDLIEDRDQIQGNDMPKYEVNVRSSLNMRATPNTDLAPIGSLSRGQIVYEVDREYDRNGSPWSQIDLQGDGIPEGYVSTRFLRRI